MSDETKLDTKIADVVYVVEGVPGFSAYKIVINRGSKDGVKIGDRYLIFGEGPQLSDPKTGTDLGILELVRGRGTVYHVQETMAHLRSLEVKSKTRRKHFASTIALYMDAADEVEEEQLPFDKVEIGDRAKPI